MDYILCIISREFRCRNISQVSVLSYFHSHIFYIKLARKGKSCFYQTHKKGKKKIVGGKYGKTRITSPLGKCKPKAKHGQTEKSGFGADRQTGQIEIRENAL